MAKELLISVAIGAVLQGSYLAAFAGAKRTLEALDNSTKHLKQQHEELGKAMQRAVGTLSGGSLAALNRDYEKLGRTLDALRLKQEKLAASMARGVELKQVRQEHWAGMKESAATAVAVGAPLLGSVKQASKFEAGLRDIAITGNLTKQEELQVGSAIRQAALQTSQGHAAILEGVGTLVAAGMDAKKAGQQSALLGKVATATNADMKDLAGMVYSFSETLGIKGDAGLKEAFNRAAYGGKLGRFELKDMAKALPEMTAAFAAKGVKGQKALTQIIASLEVGREGAGSGDEAVTNLRNWLSHMNAQHTISAYEKAGVDYKKSMSNLVASGDSSYEASLKIANKFIASKGDAFMKAWKNAGAKGDEEAQRRLMESFGLNEVFQDIQTINHLLAMRQGWDKYQDTKKKMGSKEALGTIDQDFIKRSQTAEKAWQRFTTQITDVAITIGNAFLPAVSGVLDSLAPVIKNFGTWADKNPGLLRGIVGVVGGMVALRTAIFGLKFLGNFLVLAPLNSMGTAVGVLSSRVTILRAMMAGGASRFSLLLQFFGMGATRAGRLAAWLGKLGGTTGRMAMSLGRGILTAGGFLLPFGKGLLTAFGAPLMLAGRGMLFLGKLLAGNLLSGLRVAGQAVLWLGRAMMMNPIGLAITGIAVGAYLIYRYWDKIRPWFLRLWAGVTQVFSSALQTIKSLFFNYTPTGLIIKHWDSIAGWFRGLWARIKTAFSGGLAGIAKTILNWSPLGLFYQAFAGIMEWFGFNLPKSFSDFGAHLIGGLVSGIQAKTSAAKDAIVGFAKDVKGWFANTLGIKSPSRVFMGYGDNIAQGAALGVQRSAGLAAKATAGMALATTAAWGQPTLPAPALTTPPALHTIAPQLRSAAMPELAYGLPMAPQRLEPSVAAQPKPLLQPVAQALQPAAMPELTDSLQMVRQRLVPAKAAQPKPLLQPVIQELQPATMPELAGSLQMVRQRLVPAMAAQPKPLLQPVAQVLQPATMPELADNLQMVRQRLVPAVAAQPKPLLQQVGQVLQPATMPELADNLQMVRQRLVPAEAVQPKPLLQPVAQVLQPAAVPELAYTLQMVRQRVVPFEAAQPKPLLQPVAQVLRPEMPSTQPPAREALAQRVRQAQAALPAHVGQPVGGGMTITFAPQIHVKGGNPAEVKHQVGEALQLSFTEFERMMRRYEADKQRRSYGGRN